MPTGALVPPLRGRPISVMSVCPSVCPSLLSLLLLTQLFLCQGEEAPPTLGHGAEWRWEESGPQHPETKPCWDAEAGSLWPV